MTTHPFVDTAVPAAPTGRHIIVFGGYGTFGRLVVESLAQRGHQLTIAGRTLRKAQQLSDRLGAGHRALEADVGDSRSCRQALDGHEIAINCAGPFSETNLALLDASIAAGVHHLDLADDRHYVRQVFRRHTILQERGLVAAVGCSSLPGLSGCAAVDAFARLRRPIAAARVTLLIGNKNPKGLAAVQSAANQLGTTYRAPQAMQRAFGDPQRIPFPPPLRHRIGLNFNAPEYDLFPDRLGAGSVAVKVAFESRLVRNLFSLSTRMAPRMARRALSSLARWLGRWPTPGSPMGAVLAEVFDGNGDCCRTCIWSATQGQRMAVAPCLYAVDRLCTELPAGAWTAYDLCGAEGMLENLVHEGYHVTRADSPPS